MTRAIPEKARSKSGAGVIAALSAGRAVVCATLVLLMLPVDVRSEPIASRQKFFSRSVGLLTWEPGGSLDGFRGSGCVAWDRRLVFSCAHVFYNNGWATGDHSFYPGYDSADEPTSGGVALRGFRKLVEYSANRELYGPKTAQAYDKDVTVFYNYTDIAASFAAWHDGRAQLTRRDRRKLIAGYPALLYADGAEGFFFQHSTPSFRSPARRVKDTSSYYEFGGVTTGSGNSGGPVFVYNEKNQPVLAAVLVSGDAQRAGVRALDADTKLMAEKAIGHIKTNGLRTFSNTDSFTIPDGTQTFSSRSVRVSGFTGNVDVLRLSVDITTPHHGDLGLYLRSPRGRIFHFHLASPAPIEESTNPTLDGNLVIKDLQCYSGNGHFPGIVFAGNPNGTWKLFMADVHKGRVATFNSFSLTVGAL